MCVQKTGLYNLPLQQTIYQGDKFAIYGGWGPFSIYAITSLPTSPMLLGTVNVTCTNDGTFGSAGNFTVTTTGKNLYVTSPDECSLCVGLMYTAAPYSPWTTSICFGPNCA